MRKRLQIVLMAALATSFSLHATIFHAEAGDSPAPISSAQTPASEIVGSEITASDENGRKIYVNESAPVVRRPEAAETPRRSLMYWSTKDNRWKPVPAPNTASMKAARSAAAEVKQYFGRETTQAANARIQAANATGVPTSPQDIDAAITMAAARHNVDPNLVRAVVKVESNFNPNAVSRKGAMGLMQLMPSTARSLKVQNPFDPQQNVDAGVRHLKQLLESYGGNVKLTLAAYNAGSGAVARSAGVPHYAETQNYVRRITKLYYGNLDYGGLNVAPAAEMAPREPVRVQRDARGVLYISNTD
jgi:soluble lytic murein transglycosylase-like protein